MKSPALSDFARCTILTSMLLAAAGCDLIPKRDKAHASPAAPAASAADAPVPPPATPSPTPVATSAVASAPKPPAPATPPPFPAPDKKFFDTAPRILAYQRRLGALAKQYGNSDEARNLGGLMEEEMAIAGENLKTLATTKKQQIGGGVWGHGGLERLASQRGEGFDRSFYEEVKLSGAESYAEFDQAFSAVKDGGVKEFAKNWYPVLRNYPREAIKLELKLDKKRR